MSANKQQATRLTIEGILKEARPRVLGVIQRRFTNLELAEDCFQEACIRALKQWPGSTIPNNPAAWLRKVAENLAIDSLRKSQTALDYQLTHQNEDEGDVDEPGAVTQINDDLLRLLWFCCHPELVSQDRIALALKIVCGLPVLSIARGLLVNEKTMEKRITRAKKKAAELALDADTDGVPAQHDDNRLESVLGLLYLVFNEGYSSTAGDQHIKDPLCREAIRLCRLLLNTYPDKGDIHGLLALFLLQHARRDARVASDGTLVPLEKQNRSLWEKELIQQGLIFLSKSKRLSPRGTRYQLQACIAAEHCTAKAAEHTNWGNILRFYDLLFILEPSPVVKLNRAVAVYKVMGAEAALEELSQLEARLANFLYFHTTRAGILLESGNLEPARLAFQEAKHLNPGVQELAFIDQKLKDIALSLSE